MFKYLASVAAIALTAGAVSAQETADPRSDNFGATVKTMAQAQRDAETKGIGADVSAAAKERNALRKAARDADDDDDDDDADDTDVNDDTGTAVAGRASANPKSAVAQAALVAAARGDNRSVKDNTGAVADLRSSRSGREFGADARAAAAEARMASSEGRRIASEARAAAQQARDVRDTVRNARPGRGGR